MLLSLLQPTRPNIVNAKNAHGAGKYRMAKMSFGNGREVGSGGSTSMSNRCADILFLEDPVAPKMCRTPTRRSGIIEAQAGGSMSIRHFPKSTLKRGGWEFCGICGHRLVIAICHYVPVYYVEERLACPQCQIRSGRRLPGSLSQYQNVAD